MRRRRQLITLHCTRVIVLLISHLGLAHYLGFISVDRELMMCTYVKIGDISLWTSALFRISMISQGRDES